MEKDKLEYFKKRLLDDKTQLEDELKSVGRINPDNPEDWEPIPPGINDREADLNKLADDVEGFEENSAILKQLETRLQNVKKALAKIDAGTYGICEVSGDEIEMERLEANPAARTNIANKDKE